jgi:uncharacterized phiE125 gp8 family phage protein
MWNRIERVTQPAAEAITRTEAKSHLRVDHTDDDTLIDRLIKAARQAVEGPDGAGVVLMASQWTLKLDHLHGSIWIPTGPVLSIDSIVYVDDGGASQTLPGSDYQWRKGRYEARIAPAYNLSWPTVRRQYDAVTVTFTAGFDGTGDSPPSVDLVPEGLRQAMLLLIGHWYANRETVVIGQIPATLQFAFDHLVNAHRVGRVA